MSADRGGRQDVYEWEAQGRRRLRTAGRLPLPALGRAQQRRRLPLRDDPRRPRRLLPQRRHAGAPGSRPDPLDLRRAGGRWVSPAPARPTPNASAKHVSRSSSPRSNRTSPPPASKPLAPSPTRRSAITGRSVTTAKPTTSGGPRDEAHHCALAVLLATLALAATAQADPHEYGIESVSAGVSDTQAAAHPDFTVDLALDKDPEGALPSATKDLRFELPPGLLANPQAIPTCSAAQLVGTDVNDPSNETGCPQASQVGITEVQLFTPGSPITLFEPVFNLEPRPGEPARFGFVAQFIPTFIDTELEPGREYAATAKVEGVSVLVPLLAASTTFWGTPADESHDYQRISAYEALHNGGVPDTETGKRPAGLVPAPYMLNPARCGAPGEVRITATSYDLPDLHSVASAPLLPNTGCGALEFEPDLAIAPTTSQAETGSGLDVNLSFPTEGLKNPELLGGAIQKRAEVALPEGVTVNPSQAVGLGVCSEADFAKGDRSLAAQRGLPGDLEDRHVTRHQPAGRREAEGSLFIAKPKANPFGTLIALYLVLEDPRPRRDRQAGRARSCRTRETGQLVTTFGEPGYEIPQLPVSAFHLHFREGARSPLVTPPRCGTYTSDATFTAWSGQVVTTYPELHISSGVDGGPCPRGTPPFHPGFEAGTVNNAAGSFSPFYLRLTRQDGDQDLTKFCATLPPGVLAKLAGVSKCPDASIEAAKGKAGKEEQSSPSCPASSQIGHVLAGAGVGQVLTYAEGKLYLAGPYNGAPLSVASIVPAVAGPFDVGTVVTRVALRVDPRTGVASVDGSASDPIPHILAGIPLKVRDIRVYADRPSFTLNPTSCDPFQTTAQIWGGGNDVFSSADDSPFGAAARFQAANCASLGFKPKLALNLKGPTKRGDYQSLRAVVKTKGGGGSGEANIASAAVTLPHSAFLANEHIRTVCTRVQYAAGAGNGAECPKGSIYGRARAVTPLLDDPLEGPVYLRSSSHPLPDVVVALHGLIDIELSGQTDSVNEGIRNTFASVPDAPATKFVLELFGGKKALIVNSRNLCQGPKQKATAHFTGQNGAVHDFRPVVRNSCKKKKAKRGKHGRRR